MSEGQLSILNTQKKDSGLYKCQASNPLGHDSAVTDLNVVQRPHFIVKPPAHLNVSKMQNITVRCQAAGHPQTTVTWKKINGTMPGRRSAVGADGTLKIWNPKLEDSGTYACTASSNLFSSVFVAMALTVEVPSMKNTLALLKSFNCSFRNTLPHIRAPSFDFCVICVYYVMLSSTSTSFFIAMRNWTTRNLLPINHIYYKISDNFSFFKIKTQDLPRTFLLNVSSYSEKKFNCARDGMYDVCILLMLKSKLLIANQIR